ncbi:MAG TPA: exodeoxyribonuclease VII large subunit, partial [Solirubrobacteraceae bacterium]|nr:exodeoxyribonuclease VII large subunit [Solirubrobacteraceae bacterium]
EHVARERRKRHQALRELRASATRRLGEERAITGVRAEVLRRKASAAAGPEAAARRAALHGLALALEAHDPQRVLERGYAVVEERSGERVITTAAAARAAGEVRLRFADAAVDARISESE